MGEFEIIRQNFADQAGVDSSGLVDLGIGDDCALLNNLPVDQQWAISTDMFIEGRHFFPGTSAFDIGYKALAVNLSDLAAMGARPMAFSLALALPNDDPIFLKNFSQGLFTLAKQANCQLIGGDTTKGSLNICITVYGSVPKGKALRRSGAKVGDDVWVSGSLGAAAWAVQEQYAKRVVKNQSAANKLHRPAPRIELGLALRDVAHSALDLSDGLIGDLGHIAKASNVRFEIHCPQLPIASEITHLLIAQQWQIACSGGDDYELAFTASPERRHEITLISHALDLKLTRIGGVTPRISIFDDEIPSENKPSALTFLKADARPIDQQVIAQWQSFQHFSN